MTLKATDDDYLIDSGDPATQQRNARRGAESASVRAGANAELDISYGAHPRHRFDLFWPAKPPRAVLIFIHGGWWKSGSKDERAFLAPTWVEDGVAFATVNYPLAPEASLETIVASVKAAIDAICARVQERVGGAVPYLIAGNSAGGHLTAYLASAGQKAPHGKPIGVCAMSGLYDLAPIATVFPNEWMRLADKTIKTLSPIHVPPSPNLPYLLLVGAEEPAGFKTQMGAFVEYLRAKGVDCTAETVPDRGHLSIIGDLAERSSIAYRWLTARVQAEAPMG